MSQYLLSLFNNFCNNVCTWIIIILTIIIELSYVNHSSLMYESGVRDKSNIPIPVCLRANVVGYRLKKRNA